MKFHFNFFLLLSALINLILTIACFASPQNIHQNIKKIKILDAYDQDHNDKQSLFITRKFLQHDQSFHQTLEKLNTSCKTKIEVIFLETIKKNSSFRPNTGSLNWFISAHLQDHTDATKNLESIIETCDKANELLSQFNAQYDKKNNESKQEDNHAANIESFKLDLNALFEKRISINDLRYFISEMNAEVLSQLTSQYQFFCRKKFQNFIISDHEEFGTGDSMIFSAHTKPQQLYSKLKTSIQNCDIVYSGLEKFNQKIALNNGLLFLVNLNLLNYQLIKTEQIQRWLAFFEEHPNQLEQLKISAANSSAQIQKAITNKNMIIPVEIGTDWFASKRDSDMGVIGVFSTLLFKTTIGHTQLLTGPIGSIDIKLIPAQAKISKGQITIKGNIAKTKTLEIPHKF